jgi:hypothetical protein
MIKIIVVITIISYYKKAIYQVFDKKVFAFKSISCLLNLFRGFFSDKNFDIFTFKLYLFKKSSKEGTNRNNYLKMKQICE